MLYATKSATFRAATSGRPVAAPAPRAPVARRLVTLRADAGDKASEAARDAQKSVGGGVVEGRGWGGVGGQAFRFCQDLRDLSSDLCI